MKNPDPTNFFNRELSWLNFNYRVMQEARNTRHPLLERIKYLAIYISNMEEFYMIRVSGLRRQLVKGALEAPPDGLSPAEQLAKIHKKVNEQLAEYAKIWNDELSPLLAAEKINIVEYSKLSNEQKGHLTDYFREMIFPILTPMAFDPTRPFPHISSLSVNLAIIVCDSQGNEGFARLKLPDGLQRLVSLQSILVEEDCNEQSFVWLEDIIANNLNLLFPGYSVLAASPFRVIRDADIELDDDDAADLWTLMQEQVELRQFGGVVSLEVQDKIPDHILKILVENLHVTPDQVIRTTYPLALSCLWELTSVNRPDLKYAPIQPKLMTTRPLVRNIFDSIKKNDFILYHPYDSFQPVEEFLWAAAESPDVLAIKQTLYRVGKNADIIKALIRARSLGKQVTVLVELRARFDEANNISWAQELEKAGVHVIYGLVGLKVHTKMTLVLRQENKSIVSYAHLGTGNYNPETARLYCDFSLFTCRKEMCSDVLLLFHSLTGYANHQKYKKLLVAPEFLRQDILKLINDEIHAHGKDGKGHIILKLNSLVDKECIAALYRASQAGVRVELQIRGICCLRPGLKGISDNIKVTSIVGRFLEHTRIFYFCNGGNPKLYLGSADLMPRNLDRRVEILFPIEQIDIQQQVLKILSIHLGDNVQSWHLTATGDYEKIHAMGEETEIDSQSYMLNAR